MLDFVLTHILFLVLGSFFEFDSEPQSAVETEAN